VPAPPAYYTSRLDPTTVRLSIPALAAALAFSAGCGYIGSPMPPLANVPAPVSNLAALQRGGKIVVQLTIPALTTEGHPIKPPLVVDLRIGGEPSRAPAVVTGANARYEIPAAAWTGKDAVFTARAVGSNGKASAWSAPVTVPVLPAPPVTSAIAAASVPAGVKLTWLAAGAHFHVLRQTGSDKDAAYALAAADVTAREWLDSSVEFGKPYTYLVQTFVPLPGGGEAQSDLPEPVSITPVAPLPGVPTGMRAVASSASVELSWDTPEGAAPAGYRLYRAAGGGEFALLAELGLAPAYSDRTVEAGKTYSYAVSAVDATGRESARSSVAEAGLQ